MNITRFPIPGLLLIEPKRFTDERGWFCETWQQQRYRDAGIDKPFVQDNLAKSSKGVLRGLHAQEPFAQGKLVQVFEGAVFDVAVDLRVGSPTFGKWHGITLSGDNGLQFYVPPGFGHGYYVISDEALFAYKCTDVYSPQTQFGVRWNDPALGIEWPLIGEPILSDKDREAPLLADIPVERFTKF
ncbi:dTDP-4-dehydrorhamnose 3,5-epimerase [Thiosocius teredinicola]|uniref:dTDP-4-dehydrorhamnose 3,5-epimerase n=1 Tax=Thiosocius teredinicola TaxID=1973002 RepID=UPI000990CCC6